MDLSRWLNSDGMRGFKLAYVVYAELLDTATNPMQTADPAQLRIVSGYPGEFNAGTSAVLINVLPREGALQAFIDEAQAAVIDCEPIAGPSAPSTGMARLRRVPEQREKQRWNSALPDVLRDISRLRHGPAHP